ncbi:MAG: GTPase Era [Anaerolineales bacterium]|jgi:GTP-binding protein Era|nr:GTPase Era [Anaerolineales bacterium]
MNSPSPTPHKSGIVAILGHPNVGKSTLLNALCGQKIAAVSPRPQTTRRRQLGILTLENAQVIFVDTPGVHQPRHKLGEKMNQMALETLQDADLIFFIVDASRQPDSEDLILADGIRLAGRQAATFLLLNKIDLLSPARWEQRKDEFLALLPEAKPLFLSATRGEGKDELMQLMLDHLPEGPQYYPEDQVTDLFEREIAADLIREAALLHLDDEVPHGIAVRIDEYTDREDAAAYIAATLILERETHKPIVIGRGGSMLKKIGSDARKEIEALTGRKIFLELRVKVRKNWRDDDSALQAFGFGEPEGKSRT